MMTNTRNAIFFLVAFGVGLIPSSILSAQDNQTPERYYLDFEHSSKTETLDGSYSGSSSGSDDLIETIITRTVSGEIVEFDLVLEAGEERPLWAWQYPIRVLRPAKGPMTVLNRDEMVSRRDRWLEESEISPDYCGHWSFSWTAFQIKCDPASALEIAKGYDLRLPGIEAGAPFLSELAAQPIALAKTGTSERHGSLFSGQAELDPQVLVDQAVETDLITAQILQKPMTEQQARTKAAESDPHGTITVIIQTDETGSVWRREQITRVTRCTDSGDSQETVETRSTLVRSPYSPPAGAEF